MWDTDSNYAEATYDSFGLTDADKYTLQVGAMEPNLYGLLDDLRSSNGAAFSTSAERGGSGSCRSRMNSPWW